MVSALSLVSLPSLGSLINAHLSSGFGPSQVGPYHMSDLPPTHRIGVTEGRSLSQWKSPVRVFIFRYLIYPYVISRHTLAGPWGRVGIFTHLVYVTANFVLIFYKNTSLENIGRRAGGLSLINIIFPLAVGHLSYTVDLLGISLLVYRKLYRALG
jgi:hypothetical protein